MPDQLLECLVGHHHFVGTAAVDETNDLARVFQHQEALRILRDAGADLLQRGRLIAFIGTDFDGVAAFGVGGCGCAELRGAHGGFPW
ncbi:hypothetical protein D3C86_1875680 [compost metagenome]